MAVDITCICDLKSEVGEGLFWDEAQQALHFVDIPAGTLYRLKEGRLEQWSFQEPLGCLALDAAGDPVLALTSGITRVNLATGARQVIANPEAHLPQNRFNDGVVDRQGRFWLGTMKRQGPPEPTGTFYRLDGDGRVTAFWDGIFTTNGLAFSPDGRTMYLADSNPGVRTIWACDYDIASGTPGERRVFFDTRQVAGRPDGATVDADGCYWMAGVGGWQLYRITPQGVVDRVVDMPCEKPSRPWFGGPKLDVLYCTSLAAGLTPGTETRQPNAGGLFAIHGLGVTGLAQPRYAG